VLVLIMCAVGFGTAAQVAPQAETELVAKARELVDIYYGDDRLLTDAADLLAQAYKANPKDANLYVQAARITVMGGFIQFDTYQAGTFDRYAALLDKALKLDPRNAKARILRAQVFARREQRVEQLKELEHATALGTKDPWLQIGYGNYFGAVGDAAGSYQAYAKVMERGPGSTPSERKAYVNALGELSRFGIPGVRKEDWLRKHAEWAVAARYPTDAWTPLGYAEDFIDYKAFDDAIFYARIALKTMNFAAGRKTLAGALYAKAAELRLAQRPASEVMPLVSEAGSLGIAKSSILEYLMERRGIDDNLRALEPVLREIIR
jgi:tetratricopeptide (TPR) repeat protein